MSSYYFYLSIQPNFNPSYGSSIEQCSHLKENDQSEFNFVLAESSAIKYKFHLFHCIQGAFIVTQKLILWYLSIATASHIQFLHHWYPSSIPDWSCLMLTKDRRVKRASNALAMVSISYLYDYLNSSLSDDKFISSENSLPVVYVLKE